MTPEQLDRLSTVPQEPWQSFLHEEMTKEGSVIFLRSDQPLKTKQFIEEMFTSSDDVEAKCESQERALAAQVVKNKLDSLHWWVSPPMVEIREHFGSYIRTLIVDMYDLEQAALAKAHTSGKPLQLPSSPNSNYPYIPKTK